VSDGIRIGGEHALDGMRDFIEVPVSHTFIMRNREVARQAIEFLRAGHFAH
jgi:hypothetical protein